MLRISIVESSSNQAFTLRVEGEVKGCWVEELRRSCEEALVRGSLLRLDLRDVSFADSCGIALLRNLSSRQVALVNPSPFVGEQLKGAHSDRHQPPPRGRKRMTDSRGAGESR
jgi:anti-anti-sigma factor